MLRRIALLLLCVTLLLPVLCACGDKEEGGPVSQEEAKQIVMADLGSNAASVTDMHVHLVEEDGVACYSIHVTYGSTQKTYLVHGLTGQILSVTDGGH